MRSKWQAIETAPNDGSKLLGAFKSWDAETREFTYQVAANVFWSSAYKTWKNAPSGKRWAFTHWMPMPVPPK